MGISKETIKRIYKLAGNPDKIKYITREDLEDLLVTAAELAEYYEAEEARRAEKEMRSERRRE